ncbi:EamA domain-containing membrane protein RarD [Dokdonella immobilis]|uniref:EamA domain-containing membrane protein RarD n=2 Tax=Dokdonella immobilis TaxID=578942 RepID=A0A1I4YCT2_9GAMM|nr:EamA domain-containing membrane protein RarD [Dokdonella immobilis]
MPVNRNGRCGMLAGPARPVRGLRPIHAESATLSTLSATTKAQMQIHFCVLLWGFTPIIGKLISLPALPLVWWRMLLVVAVLTLIPRAWRGLRKMSLKLVLAYAGIGVLVALHWLTFYGAIKLSNASVAATCIALATAFTALIEPKLAHRRFSRRELVLGLSVLPGVALVVGGVPDSFRLGIVVGALSALLVAIFGSLNKRLVEHGDALTVTGIELGAGTLALTVLAPVMPWLFPAFAGSIFEVPGGHDLILLLCLSIACTLLPFALSLVALRHMTAFSAQLAVNLEPVYAIVLAAVLFGEQRELTPLFYLGVVIILGAVFIHPLINRAGETVQPEILAVAEAKNILE